MQTLKIIFVNIFIFFCFIFFGEVLLNLRYQESNKFFLHSSNRYVKLKELKPNTDKIFVPDDNYMQVVDHLEQKKYRIRTSNDGFIIGPNNLNHNDSVDIIFYGGSTTECLYVDEEKRFPYLVQETLNKNLEKNIQVYNSGVSAKNSYQSLIDFISKGLKYKPKTVVFMHAINDQVILEMTNSYFIGPDSRIPINFFKDKFNQEFDNNKKSKYLRNMFPNIYFLSTRILEKLKNNDQNVNDEWADYRNNDIIDKDKLFYNYETSIRTFINVAKANNVNVILMTQFNRIDFDNLKILEKQNNARYRNIGFKRDLNDMIFIYSELNNIVRKISYEKNIDLIDLDKLVPKTSKYIYDPVHLNTDGSIFVSKIISDHLIKNYYNKN